MTRQKRITPSTKFNTAGFQKSILQETPGKKELLNDSNYKDQFIEMII